MQIYLILIGINLVLVSALWKTTRYQPFMFLILHWVGLLASFVLQRAVAPEEPFVRAITLIPINFCIHYSLNLALADMLKIPLPLKKWIFLPFLSITATFLLHSINASSEWIAAPMVVTHSFIYFYLAYHAFRFHFDQLTLSLKGLLVVMILSAMNLYTYPYFYTRFELLAIGFTIALGLVLGISILFPAAIIERITQTNARLEAEVQLKAQMTHTAKMAALGEMAGGVAHEMNTPLAVLSLILERIDNQIKEGSNLNEMGPLVKKGQTTVHRMSQIVKGLLTFSKEDPDLRYIPVAAQELVQDTLILCSERMKRHEIQLKLDFPNEPLIFLGQPTQISQVLLNLLNNAFDAIENSPDKWILVTIKDQSSHVEFSVTDSGSGIRQENREKLFQPFFTTKDIGKGTGLGLSISKGIVESHQGKMYLDGSSDKTRFVFLLPKNQKQKRSPEGSFLS